MDTHTGEKANLCPGMLKRCRKGPITFPLWLSHVHWSEFREDRVEERMGKKHEVGEV